jgi:hypothetical protein
MDRLAILSEQLLGLWLAIVGISIVFGVLFAVGDSLLHRIQHRNRAEE